MFVPQYRMVDPAHGVLDESYTPEDDSHEVHSVFSEEGTTRRLDNGVRNTFFLYTVKTLKTNTAQRLYGLWNVQDYKAILRRQRSAL